LVGKSSRQGIVIKPVRVGKYRSQIDVWKVQGNENIFQGIWLNKELRDQLKQT
jgi:hypothetical protein